MTNIYNLESILVYLSKLSKFKLISIRAYINK